MYAGFESPGGPCDAPNSRLPECEFSNTCGTGGYETTVSCNCGAKGAAFVGVVLSFEQFNTQHRRAVATRGSWLAMSAALQQSMSAITSSMPQDCWPNCTGTPANALPPSIRTRTRDVSRIRMTVLLYVGLVGLSRFFGPTKPHLRSQTACPYRSLTTGHSPFLEFGKISLSEGKFLTQRRGERLDTRQRVAPLRRCGRQC